MFLTCPLDTASGLCVAFVSALFRLTLVEPMKIFQRPYVSGLNSILCSLKNMAAILYSSRHFKPDLVLQSVLLYLDNALSCRDKQDMMQE